MGEPEIEIHPVDEFPGERPHMDVRAGSPHQGRYRARDGLKGKRRGAGVVERGGLENRCTLARTEGSNPSLSAK